MPSPASSIAPPTAAPPAARPLSWTAQSVRRLFDDQSHSFAEAIPNIVWTAEPDGYIDYYNQRWYEYAGMTWEESDRHGWRPVMHPDDYQTCQDRWATAIATGRTYEIEYRLRRLADGQFRWHLGRAVPVRDEAGRIVKWFGSCTDIHDQKLAQSAILHVNRELEERVALRTRELDESREQDNANLARLQRIIDTLPLGAAVVDEQRTILYINERFCQLFRLTSTPSEYAGKAFSSIVDEALDTVLHPQTYAARLDRTFEERIPQLNQEILLRDGRALLRDYLPIDVHGRSRGHVLLYRDVTQERRVDSAKSEFMSLASHQLRTPLTRIRWALGRLAKMLPGTQAQEAQDSLQVARNAVIHMSETISTMLSIARIEAKKISVRHAPVDLAFLLNALHSSHRNEIAARQQILTIECAASCVIPTDESILQEVLDNLLSNALKYTPRNGEVHIRVWPEGARLRIDVADNGYGIPQYQQDKIFTKFFRGDNILQKNTDGNGLGLYLTFRLVGLLQGQISFVSEEGSGTTFTLLLPT